MFTAKTFTTLAFAAYAVATKYAAPLCDADYNYNEPNYDLGNATIQTLDITSRYAAAAGMTSVHIIGYDGFARALPDYTTPVQAALDAWAPALAATEIKCPTCVGGRGKLRNQRPRAKPVVDYDYLYTLFDVTTNFLLTIDAKQCSVNGYFPPKEVKAVMAPLLSSLAAAYGPGKYSSYAQTTPTALPTVPVDGAVLPFYECLLRHGSTAAVDEWEASWFPLVQAIEKLRSSACAALD